MRVLLEKHECFETLMPLADQVLATNWIDEQKARSLYLRIEDVFLQLELGGRLNTKEKWEASAVIRIYLHEVVNGAIKGRKGALITEKRRRITTDTGASRPPKRGFFNR